MEQIALLAKELMDRLNEQEAVISADFNFGEPIYIQMTFKGLMELAEPCKENPEGYEIEVEDVPGGKAEFQIYIHGVQFFALADQKQHEEYFAEKEQPEEGIPVYANDMRKNMEIAGMSEKDFS